MKVHTRKQVMYSLDVASERFDFDSGHRAVKLVAEVVSKITGGCTLIDSTGYWADVERADKESYDEYAIGVENNVQLQVKCEVNKEKKLEKAIVDAFVIAGMKHPELKLNWVCGHKVTADGSTIAFNFSIKENLDEAYSRIR